MIDPSLPHQVGRAATGDIPRLVEIRAAVRGNRLSDPASVTPADIQWFIDNGPIWTWVEARLIRGFSAGDPRDGTIWALFVDPRFEGRGIGRALIDLACGSLRRAGHRAVSLGTLPGTRAENFYRRNGWVPAGHRPNGEILYRREL
jgi:GNAT superfamily N-acetyltransferase